MQRQAAFKIVGSVGQLSVLRSEESPSHSPSEPPHHSHSSSPDEPTTHHAPQFDSLVSQSVSPLVDVDVHVLSPVFNTIQPSASVHYCENLPKIAEK